MKITRKLIRIISLAALLLAFSANVYAQTEPPLPELFSPPNAEETRSGDRSGPEVIRMRSTEVDYSILEQIARSGVRPDAPDFVLNLFDDVSYQANIQKIESFSSGSIGMVGVVDSPKFNELVLVTRDGAVQATLFVGQAVYEIRFTGDGHTIVEVDQSGYPDSLPHVVPDESIQPEPRTTDPIVAADPADEIDVLVVYTQAARNAAGGTLAIESSIEESIQLGNVGYSSSGIVQRLNLVGMEQVTYNESVVGASDAARWNYALYRLTFGYYQNGGDPTSANYLADARAYREQYGADLVVMVTNLSYYCGLGWLGGDAGDARLGFSVVQINCTGGSSLTVPHEMGHNMGACHDWNNTAANLRPYCWASYSYGYQQLSGGFYTVMAYNPGGSVRINRWSNPAISYKGYPTSGLVLGQSVYPNNALTLNNTAINVANYRQSIPITGSFIQPGQTKSLLIPRVTLSVNAASFEGAIVNVTFRAFYDGTWHELGTDTNGADGWQLAWNATGINEQTISLEAVITDSASNTKTISMSGVSLTSSHVSIYGYQSRGGAEAAVEPAEQQPAAAVTDTAPASPVVKHKEVTQILHYRHCITSLFRPR